MSYILVPTYGDRHRATAYPGSSTTTSVKMLVATMIDPDVTALTVVVNGVTYTAVTGSPGANEFQVTSRYSPSWEVWTGLLEVTGLSQFTRYTWELEQGTEADNGSMMTAPGMTDDFAVFMITCDNNTNLSNGGNGAPHRVPGYYQVMKRYAESEGALPVAGIAHTDDHGYVDSLQVIDSYDETCTGFEAATTSQNAGAIPYVAGAAWMACLGMLGPVTPMAQEDMDTAECVVMWGREENRSWCKKNMNLFPQWGDHEFVNDIGFESDVTLGSNQRWATYDTVDGWMKIAWDNFLGLMQPPACNSHTNEDKCNHWTQDLGPLRFVAVDSISRADKAGTGYTTPSDNDDPTSYPQISTYLGTDQIDDVLADLDSSHPFKILLLPFGIRYLKGGPVTEYGHLAQHPIYNHCIAEYQRLFTSDTTGIMSLESCNGVSGTFLAMSGDLHRLNAQRCRSPAYANNYEEWFEYWNTGTAGCSLDFANGTGLNSGDTFVSGDGAAKSDLLYDFGAGRDLSEEAPFERGTGIRIEVYGSMDPPEMHVYLEGMDGSVLYSAKYSIETRNRGIPIDASPPGRSGPGPSME